MPFFLFSFLFKLCSDIIGLICPVSYVDVWTDTLALSPLQSAYEVLVAVPVVDLVVGCMTVHLVRCSVWL